MLVAVAAVVGWAVWGAALGVACECAAWHSWRVVCGAAATGLQLATGTGGGRALPLCVSCSMFVLFSRLRVVGLTGGRFRVHAARVSERAGQSE